ncbi:MAG: hypothetical protein JWR84_861 [Caulobacter sp.]|nr:hypothetical protein [Caulobacter sp.]
MTVSAKRRRCALSMRLPEADVAVIDRAAARRGCSRTEFVRNAAVRAAEEVVMENALIRMTPEGFADFMKTLSKPAEPIPELVEHLSRPAPWEDGYEPKR